LTHAPGIASADGVELAAVCSRDRDRAADVADEFGAAAYDDFDAMLEDVDAVAFAVPPDVQATLAAAAARAGKHLLLEKPLALARGAAADLAAAVDQTGVASVVFLTASFDSDVRAWFAQMADEGPWEGGSGVWISSGFEGAPWWTPWRRQYGGLWDVGPHVLSRLTATIGPIRTVTGASRGPRDLVHVLMEHENGAASTMSLALESQGTDLQRLTVWGSPGWRDMPAGGTPVIGCLHVAISELVANGRRRKTEHPCDVHFGRYIVDLLADAQDLLDGA
jgi:predicted dehydrogenase